jgi:iron complex outermembrane receptor protein
MTVPRLFRLVFFLAVFASPLAAAAASPAVHGLVKDSSGAVLVGAVVTLNGNGSGLSREAATDGRGRFRFEGVPTGGYTITAFRDGFAPVTQELTVGGEDISLDLSLKPAGFAEEVTVSFTGEYSRTALKSDAPARDIPLSVSSYTNSFMKTIDIKQVSELFNYMNGVNRSGGGAYDSVMRGFTNSEPNGLQTNGMPGLPARQNSPNVANVERIEVLKGPASVLYGRVQPGGLVNLITKRPQASPVREIELRGGTFFGTGPSFGDQNSYRVDGDITGPIGSGKVLYRLVASYDKLNSFRTLANNKDLLIVPSLSFNLGPGTILTVEGEYRELDNSLDQGLVAPQNDIDFVAGITTRYQEPENREREEGWAANAYLSKAFAGGVNWNFTWRSVWHDDDRKGFENLRPETDNRRLVRRDRHQVNQREYHFADTYLEKPLKTGGVSHHILFGLNGGYELRDFDRLRFNATGFRVDLYNPVYGQPPPVVPSPGFHRVTKMYDLGVYVQDRLTFSEKWKGLAALRYGWQDSDVKELRETFTPREGQADAFTPTLGLVFQPTPQWSLYGSFATSYDPNVITAVDAQGRNEFDPEEGIQFEGGVKAELLGGRVESTLALYHIKKKNVLQTVGPGISEQIGKQRSKGLEVDFRLKPLANWQTYFGYSYTDAVVTEDVNPIVVGAPLVNQATHGFNLWSRYDISSGGARGLGFGLGLIARGERAGSLPAAVVQTGTPTLGQPIAQRALILPGYFRADAGLYYVRDRYEVTLRVNNLFDEVYYESAFNLVLITPGNPREATLSFRVRF